MPYVAGNPVQITGQNEPWEVPKDPIHPETTRGLRSILERTMLDIMYDLPSRDDVSEVAIGEEVILHAAEPMIVYDQAESA